MGASTLIVYGNDAANTAPSNGVTVSVPLITGGFTVSNEQGFNVVKSACSSSCPQLGSQTYFVELVDQTLRISDWHPTTTTTSISDSNINVIYTLGEAAATFTHGSATGSFILGAETNVEGVRMGLHTDNLLVNGVSLIPVSGADAISTTSPALNTPSQTTASNTAAGPSAAPSVSSAVPTTTNSPITASPGPAVSRVLSSGAIAGIAIGTALLGALIGAAIMFFFRRQDQRQTRTQSRIGLVEMITKDREEPYDEPKSPTTGLVAMVSSNMPQAAEDRQIERELGTLCQRIRDHIGSYYDCSTPTPATTLLDLSTLGPQMYISTPELSTLLASPDTRASALCLCVSWTIVSRLSLSCDPQTSFLPIEASTILAQVRGAVISGDRAQTATFNLWRTLTANLLKSKHIHDENRTLSLSSALSAPPLPAASIHAALAALQVVLAPYVSSRYSDADRTSNLEEILKRGARFGWLLFGQPGVWEFRWELGAGEVCIFPALVQTVGDEGERLSRERGLVEGVVLRR
ncbi:hypothetical protein EJ05DRAFT_474223 [Pseudovirgaria hyperparasitica]|uniref:Uncharacterized protein n=1 Tax=Pseudovirgaria hyperparasitica TaxID=470096 RepID=A0A6A6WFH4_9PEZI|nr:uncharacterized protein EJ05DRAFT_474223 [Pseudovirgaria hyperparasitica]KAF2760337.1 hypothetical protein EJ05DRAFT_474223 [Pseudovirgaria hyperparasitica]